MSRFRYDQERGLILPRERHVEPLHGRLLEGCAQQALIGCGVDGPATDPYFANVVLLVDASAFTNGSTPSTIDVKGKTPTYRNNAQIKTDQFKFGSSSLYFDGTNDRVSFADSADWAMGTGDATWEAWVRQEGTTGINRFMLSQAASFGAFVSINMFSNSSSLYQIQVSNGATTYSGTSTTVTADAWVHVSVCRSGNSLFSSIGGVVSTISFASGVTLLDSAGAMTLGGYGDVDNAGTWKGWMDQIRITKGVARYTANFSSPVAAFPHA